MSKRISAVCAAFAALVAVVSFMPTVSTQGTSPGTAYSNLVQVGGSGIQGQLRFIDNGILAHFFPKDAGWLRDWAKTAARSRLYGGIHTAIENETGLRLGSKWRAPHCNASAE